MSPCFFSGLSSPTSLLDAKNFAVILLFNLSLHAKGVELVLKYQDPLATILTGWLSIRSLDVDVKITACKLIHSILSEERTMEQNVPQLFLPRNYPKNLSRLQEKSQKRVYGAHRVHPKGFPLVLLYIYFSNSNPKNVLKAP